MSEEEIKQDVEDTSQSQEVEIEVEENTSQQEEPTQASSEQSEEEELSSYSDKVQKRIKKLTEKYRREERDREEAVRMSKRLLEENEALKQQMSSSQQAHLSEYGQRVENQLELAREAYRKAHESNDTDKMFEAQQALNKISIEEERYRLAKNRQDSQQTQVQDSQQTQVQDSQQTSRAPEPEPDPKAKAWANKNEWFGQDEVMTYAAFGLHRKLVEDEGFDPSSDEYYDEIDKRLQEEFPHKFNNTGRSTKVAPADTSASRKQSTGRRTVKLTPSEVQMAKRLNVPLEEYAKYVQR